MTLILSLITLTGSVTYYDPGVMEATYVNRLAMRHVTPCEACIGYVAIVGGPEHLNK